MAIIVLKVHPKQKLEYSEAYISPHGVAEAEIIVLDPVCCTVDPDTKDHKYCPCKDHVHHVDISEREGKSAALYLMFRDDSKPTDYGIDVEYYGKDPSKEQLKWLYEP